MSSSKYVPFSRSVTEAARNFERICWSGVSDDMKLCGMLDSDRNVLFEDSEAEV